MKTKVVEFTVADINAEEYLAVVRFAVDEISDAVFDSGHVAIYLDLGGRWLALPWTMTGPQETIEMTYGYEPGGVFLLYTTSADFIIRENLPAGRLKIVIMPPAGAAAGKTSAHRAENFEAELRRFGLSARF